MKRYQYKYSMFNAEARTVTGRRIQKERQNSEMVRKERLKAFKNWVYQKSTFVSALFSAFK